MQEYRQENPLKYSILQSNQKAAGFSVNRTAPTPVRFTEKLMHKKNPRNQPAEKKAVHKNCLACHCQ